MSFTESIKTVFFYKYEPSKEELQGLSFGGQIFFFSSYLQFLLPLMKFCILYLH